MNFEIGQIFEGGYSPEAAVFCNSRGDCYIDEIEPIDGQRRFQIVAVPEPTDDEIAERVRRERDRRIAETDYYMMPDYPSDPNNIEEMKAYRQSLRDIPKQEGFPSKFTWPDVPKFLCEDNSDNLGLAKVGL